MTDDAPGVDAWVEQTSAFDRVRSVAATLSHPRPVSYIASEAHVAENTARSHLDRLVDMNVLLKDDQGGTAVYAPDPLHVRMQTLRDLLDEHDHDGLLELKTELQEQVAAWRDENDVDSPVALRERAAESADAAETRRIREIASDWELVEYRLGIVEDAIENYTTYRRGDRASA